MKIRHSLLNLINGIVQLELEEINSGALVEFDPLSRLAVQDVSAVFGYVQDVPSLHDLPQAADRHTDLHIVEGDRVVLLADEAREFELTVDLHSSTTRGFG